MKTRKQNNGRAKEPERMVRYAVVGLGQLGVAVIRHMPAG